MSYFRNLLSKSRQLAKSKNVRAQREKVFGGWKTKPDSPQRERQIQQISDFAQRKLNTPVRRAPGKKNKAGKIIDKPDLRTGYIEHIGNPDSLIHEIGHIMHAPDKMSLSDFQDWMDDLYGRQNQPVERGGIGYKQQSRGKPEYEATAIENHLRRRLGLPAHQKMRDVVRPEQRYAADQPGLLVTKDYPGTPVKTKDKKGNPAIGTRHLTAGKEVLSPETRQMLELRDSPRATYSPDKGWRTRPTIDTVIEARKRGDKELAHKLARELFRMRLKRSAGKAPTRKVPAKLAASEMRKSNVRINSARQAMGEHRRSNIVQRVFNHIDDAVSRVTGATPSYRHLNPLSRAKDAVAAARSVSRNEGKIARKGLEKANRVERHMGVQGPQHQRLRQHLRSTAFRHTQQKGVHQPLAGMGRSVMGMNVRGAMHYGDPAANKQAAHSEVKRVTAEAKKIYPGHGYIRSASAMDPKPQKKSGFPVA
jgi:hypothetical protein